MIVPPNQCLICRELLPSLPPPLLPLFETVAKAPQALPGQGLLLSPETPWGTWHRVASKVRLWVDGLSPPTVEAGLVSLPDRYLQAGAPSPRPMALAH